MTHAITLFSAGHDPEGYAWPSNFRTRELPLTDRHLAILWQRLRLPLPVEFITGGADIYHSPDFVLAPVLHAKRVLTIHDLSFMRLPRMLLTTSVRIPDAQCSPFNRAG